MLGKEQNIEWKNKLITYNLEDCVALKLVVEFIYSITDVNQQQTFKNVKISTDLPKKLSKGMVVLTLEIAIIF